MSDIVIRAENIGKKYKLGRLAQNSPRYRTMRDALVEGARSLFHRNRELSSTEEFWALRHVSFEIKQGEVVGIIGRNGAGKSTLLKILSRITEPATGKIKVRGRVASLLEVGTGFHPELTGKENIYLNGAILGMSRAEISSKFDEIVAFSEIERFLDTPVKRYSSGMYVRLAFAVAAHLEPEVLVIDEVLAVGDLEFQKKCLGKMQEVGRSGRTVLFVSHSMQAVSSLCDRALLLASGTLKVQGSTRDVIGAYLRSPGGTAYVAKESQTPQTGNKILQAWIETETAGKDEAAASELRSNSTIVLVVEVMVVTRKPPYVIASFWDELRRPLWELTSVECELPCHRRSQLRMRLRLPNLATTMMSVDLAVGSSHSFDDHVMEALCCPIKTDARHKGGEQRFPLAVDAMCEVR